MVCGVIRDRDTVLLVEVGGNGKFHCGGGAARLCNLRVERRFLLCKAALRDGTKWCESVMCRWGVERRSERRAPP